jgi:transposase-like protein
MSRPEKAMANLKNEEEIEEIVKGSCSVIRNNRIFTPALRLEAINFAKETSTQLASEKFQVNKLTVLRWRQEEELKML